jgi:choline dehydrogenase-like flavoprotein
MAETYDFDAIVVGSGMSGGWAAKELTERGLRVLVLEAGGPIDPRIDYVEHVQPWQMHFRGLGDRKQIEKEQPVQSRCYACDEVGHKFFVNDNENPYTTPDDAPFNWLRGRQVGGRSIMWGRQVYRWSDLDFEANAKDGHGNDWPIRYRDIAPWYEHVERFIGVSGMKEGLPQLPDGIFQKPMDLTCVERDMRDKVMKAFNGERVVTIGRVAILTEDHRGRLACHYCGNCEKGCITRSYFSSLNATLPAAAATGRLTLRPHSVVAEVTYDAKTGRAKGVRVIDALTRYEIEYTSRIVFLNASTIETVRLLLNSRSASFPNGLANSSGLLGKYVMDHNFGAGAGASYPGFLDKTTFGNRPNGFYIPRFRNVKTPQKDFLRGYGFQGGSGRQGWDRGQWTPGYGADFKQSLIDEQGGWGVGATGFGESLPREENRVTLDPEKTDAWGIPVARIAVRWTDNERAMEKDMANTMADMLEAAGCKNVGKNEEMNPPGHCIHEMGGARMSKTPKEGILNKWNQAWDVKNLFVSDGSMMCSTACQNPSITYMALTARAAANAVEMMKRNEV